MSEDVQESWCLLPGVEITVQIVSVVGQSGYQSASRLFSLRKFPESVLKEVVVSQLAGPQPEVGDQGPEPHLLQEPRTPQIRRS